MTSTICHTGSAMVGLGSNPPLTCTRPLLFADFSKPSARGEAFGLHSTLLRNLSVHSRGLPFDCSFNTTTPVLPGMNLDPARRLILLSRILMPRHTLLSLFAWHEGLIGRHD